MRFSFSATKVNKAHVLFSVFFFFLFLFKNLVATETMLGSKHRAQLQRHTSGPPVPDLEAQGQL